MHVSLFVPCFVDQLTPKVGLATAKVLKRLGHAVEFRSAQTCCGQPSFNFGQLDMAREAAVRATMPLLQKLPLPYMSSWMKTRDLPKAPAKSFRDEWKTRENV